MVFSYSSFSQGNDPLGCFDEPIPHASVIAAEESNNAQPRYENEQHAQNGEEEVIISRDNIADLLGPNWAEKLREQRERQEQQQA